MIEAALNYKAVFKLPQSYVKEKEAVHEGYENFSFHELNYEIKEQDIKFLESSGLDISHHDFEIVIDVFEKIVVLDQTQAMQHLVARFYEKAQREH